MIYEWRCTCGHKVDVVRSLARRFEEPTDEEGKHECECPAMHWVRAITAPRMHRVMQRESSDTGDWPI